MKITLEAYSPRKNKSLVLEVGQSVRIGRGHKSDFIIEDEKVSSCHCLISLYHDRLEVIDLKSKNGTYLNGIKVDQADIFIGDQIKIGNTLVGLKKDRVDQEAIYYLTFPGPDKKGIHPVLKRDFSAARKHNQLQGSEHGGRSSQLQEIKLRKEALSQIRVSKLEIRKTHPLRSVIAFMIDALFIISCSLLIAEAFASLQGSIDSKFDRQMWFVIMLFLGVSLFYAFNFIYLNFTVGEQLSGIKKIHQKQFWGAKVRYDKRRP